MADCDDLEIPSPSTSSKEPDEEKLHSANSLINALQETTDLLSSYVKESSIVPEPSFSNTEAALTYSQADNVSEPSVSYSNSSTQGKNESSDSLNDSDISMGQLDQYVVENKGTLTLEDDSNLSKYPVPRYTEENAIEQTSNDADDFCCNIIQDSEESITKSPFTKYNSPSNDTLKDYFIDIEKSETEDLPTSFEAMETSNAIIKATISKMEREILLRRETSEHKKSKLLNLPPETLSDSLSQCEREIMGDDATKTKVHILCECDQPGVAGAAVPVVTSLTSPDESDGIIRKTPITKNRPSLIPKLSPSFKNDKLSGSSKNPLNNEVKPDPKIPKKNIRFKTDSASLLKQEASKEDNSKCIRFKKENQTRRYRELTKEFSGYVSQLAKEAPNLSRMENSSAQSAAIDTIYNYVKNLNNITNELKAMQSKEATDTHQSQDSKTQIKDRIVIKFLSTKCGAMKGQNCDCNVASNCNNKSTSKKAVDIPKDSMESMDGIFIPSFDEPPFSLEDEVDEEGLGIRIKFPENQTTTGNGCSHVSVCFADVSAESLKRCPKECTLHMDFAKRKMVFQSEKSENNFLIGSDLRVTECIIDNKKSDILCIMRPKECLYPSQLIPVEGTSGVNESFRLLRTTNSELLNIVSLPSANVTKRKSLLTKSCTSIKSNVQKTVSDVDGLPDQSTRSMPQIPGRK